jgi:uncharacterized surface protein with fasciclin (FAS1) repeats
MNKYLFWTPLVGILSLSLVACATEGSGNSSSGALSLLEDCENEKDIVGTAIEAGAETLVAAVVCAELVDALSEPNGPYTVFGPTDAAFAELGLTPDNVCEALPKEALEEILLYHVALGAFDAEAALEEEEIETLQGGDVEVEDEDGMVFVNDAKVVIPDVCTTNGIIHVIDAVLIPGSDDDDDDDSDDGDDDDSDDDDSDDGDDDDSDDDDDDDDDSDDADDDDDDDDDSDDDGDDE